jgi:hypothetical protein
MTGEEQLDLSALERKARLAQHEDGLAEILAGVLSASIAAWMLTDRGAWGAIVPVLAVVMLARARRWVRYPRVGYMRPIGLWWPGRGRLWAVSTGLGALALCALWLVATSLGAGVFTHGAMECLLTFTAVLAFAGAGAVTGLRRWYVYAATLGNAAAAAYLTGASLMYGLLITAGMLLAWGGWLLSRFVRKYPVLSEDETKPGADKRQGGSRA